MEKATEWLTLRMVNVPRSITVMDENYKPTHTTIIGEYTENALASPHYGLSDDVQHRVIPRPGWPNIPLTLQSGHKN